MDELVNIPALLPFSEGGTRIQGLGVCMVCTLLVSRMNLGKSGFNKFKRPAEDEIARWNQFKRRI